MPYAYFISPKANLVCHHLHGAVSLDDVKSVMESSRKDPAFKPGMDSFIALDSVTDLQFGYNGIAQLSARMIALHGPGAARSRRIFHAPSDLTFGMIRMYKSLIGDTKNIDICIFRDFEAAVRCLGRTTPWHELKNADPAQV